MNKELMIVEDSQNIAGRVVYWRLDGTMEYETLVEAWKEAGLDEALLPSPPSTDRALKRSLRHWSSRRLLVRPLGDAVRGYALVSETADQGRLSHDTELRVVLTEQDGVPELDVDPPGHELAVDVRRRFLEATMELDTRAASTWLAALVLAVDAVGLRDKGGIYFVPRSQLPLWDQFVGVLAEVSDHNVFQIPAPPTESAVEAIIDAVITETSDITTRIEAELGDASVELGKRALATRVSKLEAILEKVGRYEELLDRRLDNVRDQIGGIRANVAAALLMAETDEEEAA